MSKKVETVRTYLATPAGVRRLRTLMIGQGLSYMAAVAIVAVEVLGSVRTEALTKIVAAIVSEIPRLAA